MTTFKDWKKSYGMYFEERERRKMYKFDVYSVARKINHKINIKM